MGKPIRIAVLAEHTRAFTRELLAGIGKVAQDRRDWSLELVNPARFESQPLDAYDGFIARILTDRDAERLAATHKPVVDIFGRTDRLEFPCAAPDNLAIGRLAGDHFLNRRFSSFAFCGYAGIRYSDARHAAFSQHVAKAGFSCVAYQTPAKALNRFRGGLKKNERLDSDGDSRELARWVKSLPDKTAVFCASDLKAWQLLSVCRSLGRRIPDDLAILGVDDDPILCSFTSPALSSINPNAFAVGQRATALLDLMLKGKHPRPFTNILPQGITVRASTEIYPLDPPWLSDALIFIHRNIASNLTAADVYNHLGLSHTTVDAGFRKTLGTSVQREIAKTRLDEARRLLEANDLPLSEIARRAGFASAAYFTRTYSAAFGITPSLAITGKSRASTPVPS